MQRENPRKVPGYHWYDWQTGEVDVAALATAILRRRDPSAAPLEEPPSWAARVPRRVVDARPTDLAKVDGEAVRAYAEHLAASRE